MTDAKNTDPTGEERYVPDEIDEWEWLVDYLREPGRLSAAVVPGQREGEALLAPLREELGAESLLVADDDVLPTATGYLAAEAGAQGKILVLALDGRRKFPDATPPDRSGRSHGWPRYPIVVLRHRRISRTRKDRGPATGPGMSRYGWPQAGGMMRVASIKSP